MPLGSDEILGTLQVATRAADRSRTPRFAPAGDPGLAHGAGPDGTRAARGDPPAEPEPRAARPGAGALRDGLSRADPHPPVGPGLHGRWRRGRRYAGAVPGVQSGCRADPRPGAGRQPAGRMVAAVRDLPPRPGDSLSHGRDPADAGHPRRIGRPGGDLHRLSQPRRRDVDPGHRPPAARRTWGDRGRGRRLPRHHPAEEGRATAVGPVRDYPRPGRVGLAQPGRDQDPRDDLQEPGLEPRRVLEGGPPCPTAPVRRPSGTGRGRRFPDSSPSRERSS